MIKQYLDSEGLRKLIRNIISLDSEGEAISIEKVNQHKVISVKYDDKTIILDSEGNLETVLGGWVEEGGTTVPVTLATFNAEPPVGSEGGTFIYSADVSKLPSGAMGFEAKFDAIITSHPYTKDATFTRLFPRNVYQYADPIDPVTWTLDVDNSKLTAQFAGSLPVYPYIVGKLTMDVTADLIHTVDNKFIKVDNETIIVNSEGALESIGGVSIDEKTIILDSEGKLSTRLGGYTETVHILEHDVQMSSLGLPIASPLPTSMNAWDLIVDPEALVEANTITLNIEADVELNGTDHYTINDPVTFTLIGGAWEGEYDPGIAGRSAQFVMDTSGVISGSPLLIFAVRELHDSEGLVVVTNLLSNNYHVEEHDEEVVHYADGELLPIDAKTIILNSEGELETALGGYITYNRTLIPEVLEPISGNGTPVIDKSNYKAWPYVYNPTPYAEDGVVTLRVHGIFANEEIDEYLEFTHIEAEELYRSESFTIAGASLKFELFDLGVGNDACYLACDDTHDDMPTGYYELYDLMYYVPEHYENVEVFHYADNRLIKVDNSTIFINSEGALQAAGSANVDEKTIITNIEGKVETQIGGWIEYTVPTYDTELLQVTGAPSGTHGDYDVYWRCNSNLNDLRDEDSLNVHAKFSIDGDEFEKDLVLTNDRGTGNYYCNYVYISDSYPESHFYVQYQDGSVDEKWCVEVMSPERLTSMAFESFVVVRPVNMNEELVQNPGLPTGSWDTFDVFYQCNSNLNTFVSELGDNLETTIHIEVGDIRGEELNQDVVLRRPNALEPSMWSDLIEIAGSSIEIGLYFNDSTDPEGWCINLYNDVGDLDLTTAEVWSATYTRALDETIHPIDGRFIPVDGSTIVVNSEGKLSAVGGGGSAINIDNWTIVHEDESDPTTPIRTAVGGGHRDEGDYNVTLFNSATFNYDDTKNIATGTFDYEILDKLVDYWPELVYVNIDGTINIPGGTTTTINYTDLELELFETSWPPHWAATTGDGEYKVFIGDDHGDACLSIAGLRGSYPSGTIFTISSDFNAPYDELYEEIDPRFMPIDHQTIIGTEGGSADYLHTAIGGWYEEEVERQLSYSRDRSTWDSESSILVFDGVSFLDDVSDEYTSQITINGSVTYPIAAGIRTINFNNAQCNLTEVSYGTAAWVYNSTEFSLEFVKNYNGIAWNYVALLKFTGSTIEYPIGESDNINLTGSYWQDEIYHKVEPRFLPIDNSTITINDDDKLVANIGAIADGKTILINSEGSKMYTALGGARYNETVTIPSYNVQLTSTGIGTASGGIVYTWMYTKNIDDYVSTEPAQVHVVCKLNGNYTDQTFEFTKDTVSGVVCWVSPIITVDGVDGKFALATIGVGQADSACFISADMSTALPTGEEYSIETFELIVPETTQEVERIDYADADLINFDRKSIIVGTDRKIQTAFGGWIVEAISIHDTLLDSEGGTEIGSNLYQWNIPNSSMLKVADRDEFLATFDGKIKIGGSWSEFSEGIFTLTKVSSNPKAWQTSIGAGAFKITITTNSEGNYILVGDGSLVPYPVNAAELTVKLKVDEAEQIGYGNSKMIEHDGTIIREGNVLKTAIGGSKEVTRDSRGLFVDTLSGGAHTYIGPGSDRYQVGWDYDTTITSLVGSATEAKIHTKFTVLGNTFEDDVVLIKQTTIPVIWESDNFNIGGDSYYIAVHDQYVGENNGGIVLNSHLTSLDLTDSTMESCDLVGEYYTAYHKVDNSYIDVDDKSIEVDSYNKLSAKVDAKTIIIGSEGLKVNTDNSTIKNDTTRLYIPIDDETIVITSEGKMVATANNVFPDGVTIIQDVNDIISVPIDYSTIRINSEGSLITSTYSINGVNLDSSYNVNTEDAKITWYGTQDQFNALMSLNPYTIYVINNNSEGSVAEEQRSYSVLKDKPKINHVTLDGDKVPEEFGIQRLMSGGSGIKVANNTVSLKYMGDVLKIEEGTLYADTYDRARLNKMLAAAKNVIVVADDLPATPTANTVYYIKTTSEGREVYNGILIDTNLNRIPLGNPNNYSILSAGDCIRIQNEAINVIKATSITSDCTHSEVATGEAVYNFVMTGCTTSEAGERGLVPAPVGGEHNKFLRGDGNWADPASMTYAAGLGIDATKMAEERTVSHSNVVTPGMIGSKTTTAGNTISLPWADYDGNGHITATGTRDHNLLAFKGATTTADGTAGLVKAPLASDEDYKKFLKGDGTWGNEAIFESATTTQDGTQGLVPPPTWDDVNGNKFLSAGGSWDVLPAFWGCTSEDNGEPGCVVGPRAGDQDMFLSARGFWTPLSNTMKSITWTINKPGIMGGTVTVNYNAGVTTLSWRLTTYASATGNINLGTLDPGWYPTVDMIFSMLKESGTSYAQSSTYLKVKSDGDVDMINAQTSNILVGACTFVTGSTGWSR